MAIVRKTFNTKPKPETKYITKTCVVDGCLETFTAKVQRGRPRKFCDTHMQSRSTQNTYRTKVRTAIAENEDAVYVPGYKPTATQRVDYLEFLLRSRGTHIAQNQK